MAGLGTKMAALGPIKRILCSAQLFKSDWSKQLGLQHRISQTRCRHSLENTPSDDFYVIRFPLSKTVGLRVICSKSTKPGNDSGSQEATASALIAATSDKNIPPSAPSENMAAESAKSAAAKESLLSAERLVKVTPKKKSPDYSLIYKNNLFITPLRAMREYLLTASELDTLWNTKRRSPYDNSPPITVYLREDVEKKAKEKYGSLEKLEKERVKAKRLEDLYERGLTSHKPLYYGVYDGDETPRNDETLEKQRRTIFKSGSGKVVVSAVMINGANTALKFFAWLYTGSHAMFAEAVHSLADTLNQLVLAFGIHQSLKNPSRSHPYGYTNFRYVSSLISGVGIFCIGAGFSWYHGVEGLLNPSHLENLYWAIAILGGSLISESATLVMAIQNINRKAKQAKTSFTEYVRRGQDPSVNVVFMEDLAAVIGVAVAASCMCLSYSTGSHVPDAVASLIIGTLLASVSAFIIQTNSNALLSRSIPEPTKRELMAALEADMIVRSVQDIKATDMGSNLIRFKAEIDIDGRMLTKKYLSELDLLNLLQDMNDCKTPEQAEAFMLLHGESVVDMIGGEIDRIETNLKKINPSVRHVDLEIL